MCKVKIDRICSLQLKVFYVPVVCGKWNIFLYVQDFDFVEQL